MRARQCGHAPVSNAPQRACQNGRRGYEYRCSVPVRYRLTQASLKPRLSSATLRLWRGAYPRTFSYGLDRPTYFYRQTGGIRTVKRRGHASRQKRRAQKSPRKRAFDRYGVPQTI